MTMSRFATITHLGARSRRVSPMVLPNRNRVHPLEVSKTDPFDMTILWPEGFGGLLYPTPDTPAA